MRTIIFFHKAQDALAELASKDAQVKLWNSDGKDGDDVSSFQEAVCGLFDDSGLGDALEHNLDIINPAVLPLLASLNYKIDRINAKHTHSKPQDIIDDPLMEEVRTLCGQLLAIGLEKPAIL